MAQEQIQIQTQKQQQVQRLSQQQMLQVKLLEMPLTELEESVNAELDDNPALEAGGEEADDINTNDTPESTEDDFDTQKEREERQDALDSALERMRSDDDLPTYDARQQHNNADYEEMSMEIQPLSLINSMNKWAKECLPKRQKEILEYLIGSLDDDGLLRKDLESISDELAIYHGIDAYNERELEDVLKDSSGTLDPELE